MRPCFIATEKFSPSSRDTWAKYIQWSGLSQLDEVVSLDPMLCPSLLQTIKDEYWPHIVNEDFLLNYFVDLDFLIAQLKLLKPNDFNLLCVARDPDGQLPTQVGAVAFEFLGYDLVDTTGSASALTNCGGFPLAFSNNELSPKGLLPNFGRAVEVQANLRSHYPQEHHADCHVWAIARASAL